MTVAGVGVRGQMVGVWVRGMLIGSEVFGAGDEGFVGGIVEDLGFGGAVVLDVSGQWPDSVVVIGGSGEVVVGGVGYWLEGVVVIVGGGVEVGGGAGRWLAGVVVSVGSGVVVGGRDVGVVLGNVRLSGRVRAAVGWGGLGGGKV